jgi:hypothetical protein
MQRAPEAAMDAATAAAVAMNSINFFLLLRLDFFKLCFFWHVFRALVMVRTMVRSRNV